MQSDPKNYSQKYSKKILYHLQTLNLKEFNKFLNKLKEIKKKIKIRYCFLVTVEVRRWQVMLV